MKVAILGWGSLIWCRGDLCLRTNFTPTGPSLHLEFSRISGNGRLTLVLDEDSGTPCRTYIATSASSEMADAIENLRARESMESEESVGFIDRLTGARSALAVRRHPQCVQAIANWLAANDFDAVIWTALGVKFKDAIAVRFSVDEAIRYLGGLEGEQRTKAFEYIRRAPEEVKTPVRAAFNERWPGERRPIANGAGPA